VEINNLDTNTNPCLLHFNGGSKKLISKEKIDEIINSSKIKLPEDLTIITFKFGDGRFPLIEQLEKNNIKYINACNYYDIKTWDNTLKLKLIYKVISEVNTEYSICLDANDILLADNFENILNKLNSNLIFSASVIKYPNVIIPKEKKLKYLYSELNSGSLLGETNEIYKYITSLQNEDNYWDSDQFIIRYYSSIYNYDLDYNCDLFQVNKIENENI
jgi:hypothetical protein